MSEHIVTKCEATCSLADSPVSVSCSGLGAGERPVMTIRVALDRPHSLLVERLLAVLFAEETALSVEDK